MLRKVSLVLSFISVLGLGIAIAMPSAFAKDNKPQQQQKKQNNQQQKKFNNQQQKKFNNQKNVVVKNKTVVVKHKYVVGHRYHGHVWYGYNRHRWRGVWYAYGVGPCWIYVDGVWFWNVLACPE